MQINLEELASLLLLTDFISKCVDDVMTEKRVFPIQKPWMKSEVRISNSVEASFKLAVDMSLKQLETDNKIRHKSDKNIYRMQTEEYFKTYNPCHM